MTAKIKIGLTALLFIGLSACATTQDATTNATADTQSSATKTEDSATETKTAEADKKICKRQAITGSRFKKKICHTAGEWETIKENAQKTADGLVNQTTINDGASGTQ